MVQLVEKVVARLPRRDESFADLEDQEMVRLTTTTTESSPAETSSSLLVEENERLRRQIEDLQTQVSVLRHRYVQQQGSNSSNNNNNNKKKNPQQAPGVVLELPRAMRGGNTSNSSSTMMAITAPLNCLRGNKPQLNRLPKDHQSFTTEDDQSTIEPGPDLEVYESSSGLKNRTSHFNNNDFHNNATKRKLPGAAAVVVTSSPTDDHTRKTELLTDGSLSSDGGGGGKHYHDPDIRLMMDLESKYVDEEEDNNEEEETGVLLPLRPRTTSSIARGEGRHHTTNPGSMEEEPFWRSVSDRAGWLVGLLALQSMSSFILARNEALLQNHLVIIQFLTMLVGAGGNAGNQASVRVIRGLATGAIDDSNSHRVLRREFIMGATLSMILGTAGCIRAAIFMTPFLETIAITTSLFMIVIISIVLGALMPLGMKWLGIDPAHSSTTIQVVMDILGVSITVWMSSMILDSGFRNWLLSAVMDAR